MTEREDATDRESELLDAARRGDPGAFRDIVLRYDDGLRALAFRLLGDRDRMDDVLQEAYVKAYRALPRFRQGSRLGTWLYRITYNACMDELRRARRGRWLRLEDVKVHDPSPDPGERATDRVAVERALSELPPHQQAVVLLIDGQGFDYQTAAEILGVPEGTVASRLHRAREALSRSLSAEGSRA